MPMRHASRWIATVTRAGLVLLLGACAAGGTSGAPGTPDVTSGPPATATTPPPATSPQDTTRPPNPPVTGAAQGRVTVSRTGGIAGVMQVLQVEQDGSWVFTDKRRAITKSGRLTAAQRQQLVGLVTSPAFVREARMTPAGMCNDGFLYAVQVGSLVARQDDCGSSSQQPTLSAVIDLMVDATDL